MGKNRNIKLKMHMNSAVIERGPHKCRRSTQKTRKIGTKKMLGLAKTVKILDYYYLVAV